MEWVSEQRAHSIGLAAAAVLVAPLVRVLSSAISSTMCGHSETRKGCAVRSRQGSAHVRANIASFGGGGSLGSMQRC